MAAPAREVFAEVYDALGPLGELRVRQVLAEFAPELAGLVRLHTTGSAGRGAPAAAGGH